MAAVEAKECNATMKETRDSRHGAVPEGRKEQTACRATAQTVRLLWQARLCAMTTAGALELQLQARNPTIAAKHIAKHGGTGVTVQGQAISGRYRR